MTTRKEQFLIYDIEETLHIYLRKVTKFKGDGILLRRASHTCFKWHEHTIGMAWRIEHQSKASTQGSAEESKVMATAVLEFWGSEVV